jgi:hypothetical protein
MMLSLRLRLAARTLREASFFTEPSTFRMRAATKYCADAALYLANSGAGGGNLLRYEAMIERAFS